MSGFVEAGVRPARIFGPVLVVVGLLMLVAAVVSGLSVLGTGTTVLAQGPAGTALTLSDEATSAGLTVLVATKDDAQTTLDDACRVSPGDNRTSPILGGAKTVRDDVTYRPFVSIKHGWTDDRTLTCSGPHLQSVLVTQDNRTPRLVLTGLLAFAGIGALIIGTIGLAARGRRQAQSRRNA
ncbi:hypothetical protein [Angustibacter luteus]|uniref:Uncharacterized protein n=1 Tax=Angustibacter luteus TaxID=658456 RepID=A0ABW1J9D0_9ACTN